MNKDLEKLIKLQEIDKQVYELEVSSEKFPVRVNELESLISEKESLKEEISSRLTTLKEEKKGFMHDVVFPTGAILEGDKILLYSGGADKVVVVRELELKDVLKHLKKRWYLWELL